MSPAEDAPPRCLICETGRPAFACGALLYPGCERRVFECPDCGAAYYWPVPAPADIARCYPHAYFKDFFPQYWKDYYKGRMLAGSLAAWKREGTILDVGCALGTLLAGVRDHSDWNVLGIEYTPAAAAAGRELNGVEIATGGIGDAPWEPGSLDYVHMNNVLEHEADPAGALAAAARLLKPGGRLHLTIPNGPVDLMPTKTLWKRWRRAVTTRHGGHLFFLSRRAIERLLERTGLRPLSIRNFHFQMGLKARGLKYRAYRQFETVPPPAPADEAAARGIPLEEQRRLIPPRPSWGRYRLGARWRRLFRWGWTDFGFDFEVLAEKPALH